MVDSLISNADQLMADLERSTPDRLSTHQNRTSALQGQIDLIRSHQASQDRRINFALAREAEESDGRSNERFVCSPVCLFFLSQLIMSCLSVFISPVHDGVFC